MKCLKRFLYSFKKYGIKKAVLDIAKKIISPLWINRKVLMFHIRKNAAFKKFSTPPGISFRELPPANYEALLKFSPYLNKKELLLRIKQAHKCIVAEHREKIIFHTWVGEGKIFIPILNKLLNLPEDMIYFYNTYTDPKHSPLKILPLFLTKMHEIYDSKSSKYKEARTIVDTALKIPVRAYKAITGADKITLIEYSRILFWKRYSFEEIDDKKALNLCKKQAVPIPKIL